MSGNVVVVQRPGKRASYIRAVSAGMGITLKHLVTPRKVTQQYPDEKWELSSRLRGTHRMATHEDGRAKCVGCGLCPTACPVNCIKLIPAEDENGDSEKLTLVPGEPWVVNLLDYQNGEAVLLATGDVPAGEYSKIRLVVSDAELVMDDDDDPVTIDVVEPIFNPSGKVDIPLPFLVTAGMDMSITLDFDAELSVQVNTTGGQHAYILRPVINMIEMN